MIPDKIYLHPDDRHWWHEGNKTDDRFVEYINKEALLEWLEFRKKDIAFKIIPGAGDPVMYGKLSMCKEIIDKLNSM